MCDKFWNVALALVVVLFLPSQTAGASNIGRICIAPVRDDASTLDRETGNRRGYVSYKFAVSLDHGHGQTVSGSSASQMCEIARIRRAGPCGSSTLAPDPFPKIRCGSPVDQTKRLIQNVRFGDLSGGVSAQ